MAYCLSKANPYVHFAVRFAAKEAIIKVLSGFSKESAINEIEVLNDSKGAPYARIHGKKCGQIEILISLSHSNDKAIAFALGVKNGKY